MAAAGAGAGSGAAAAGGARAATAARTSSAGAGAGGGGKAAAAQALPDAVSWKSRSASTSKSKSRALSGSAGKWRRALIAEFLVAAMLLGLAPLAKGRDEMGPIRFMKRGSATCAFFIILGLISAAGKGAAKASAAFGALVVLVLLIDEREAFGALAKRLNSTKDDDKKDAASLGPDESTDDDEGLSGLVEA